MNWRRMLAVSLLLATGQDVSAACFQNSVPATPTVPARPLTIPRTLIPALRTAVGQAASAGPAPGTAATATTPAATVTPAADEAGAAATTAVPGDVAGDAAAKVLAAASEQARRQLLQKLDFDRRPSAILAAWAGAATAGGGAGSPTAVNEAAASTAGSSVPADPGAVTPTGTLEPAVPQFSAVTADPATAAAGEAMQQLQQQLQTLQLAVTRGSWPEVGQLLAGFSEPERLLIHDRLVVSLTNGPANAPRGRNGQRIGERNLLRAADVIAIAELYPAAVIPTERLQKSKAPSIAPSISSSGL